MTDRPTRKKAKERARKKSERKREKNVTCDRSRMERSGGQPGGKGDRDRQNDNRGSHNYKLLSVRR